MSKSFIEEYARSNQSETYSLQAGRAYIHDTCQQVTVVSGDDFAWLANPFRDAPGTMCCQCGPDDLKKFAWQDTSEDLESYRKRLWDQTPQSLIYLYFAIIPGITFFVFFFLAMLLPPIAELTPAVVRGGAGIIAATAAYFMGLQQITAGRQRPFFTER